MTATRHRSRPRRSTRFVPTLDGLQARLAPAYLVPVAEDLGEPDPTPTEPPTTTPPIQAPPQERPPLITPRMERTFAAIDELALATGSEI